MFTGRPVQLGLVTDIQYARKPDIPIGNLDSPNGTKPNSVAWHRRYSRILTKTTRALTHLNVSNVSATMNLGDIIDGNETIETSQHELAEILECLQTSEKPIFHVLGNHCMAAGRAYVIEKLGLSPSYYTLDLSDKWRLIGLDTVDLSVDREEGHPHRKLAEEFLREHNGEPNAQPWNGGIGPDQLEWLKKKLSDTRRGGKLAIVCGHLPVYLSKEHGDRPQHVMWNPDSLASIFRQYSDVVKAYFSGHYHQGSYSFRDGVHYVVFESILDSVSDDGAWGVVQLFNDGIVIDGHGDLTSRQLKF